jgi:hypothetical protein
MQPRAYAADGSVPMKIQATPAIDGRPDFTRTRQAVVEVDERLFRGHPDVVDADLADYFGSIPHADLLKSVARRIVDRRVPHLIKTWLECPVEETDQRGRTTRTTEARDSRQALRRVHPLSSSPPPDACR